ncbi:hypothetical protein [Streptomyces sp. NPDC047999]|uniref:hypothetical protein n=1 Tax=Streptomyces sp. NPDC047999 TaxID=3365497 RepID=UPI003711B406
MSTHFADADHRGLASWIGLNGNVRDGLPWPGPSQVLQSEVRAGYTDQAVDVEGSGGTDGMIRDQVVFEHTLYIGLTALLLEIPCARPAPECPG